jgi:DNA-binding CsgD family transcriptional regulator
LKQYEKDGDEAMEPLIDELDATIRQNIDSSDDWKRFEEQFEQVHHEFIRTLSQRYPALSPTELRVCALMRANLQTKAIADLLHVHERTAQTHRYRVRRKLGLSTEDNLATFLAAI